MQVKSESIFHMTMSDGERRWLKDYLQNYLGDGEEDLAHRDLREKYYRALSHAGTIVSGAVGFKLQAGQDND